MKRKCLTDNNISYSHLKIKKDLQRNLQKKNTEKFTEKNTEKNEENNRKEYFFLMLKYKAQG